MAKGREKHQDRLNALSLFGKDLVRRCGAKCELCSASGVKLKVFEVAPAPFVPEYDKCAFLCETCTGQFDNPKKLDADHWRCLTEAVWSEIPTTQVLSLRLLKKLSKENSWASELLDEAYVEEENQEWADLEDL